MYNCDPMNVCAVCGFEDDPESAAAWAQNDVGHVYCPRCALFAEPVVLSPRSVVALGVLAAIEEGKTAPVPDDDVAERQARADARDDAMEYAGVDQEDVDRGRFDE